METTIVAGFFCEDIRTEIGGINSIVGILPDNIDIPHNPPLSMAKLALYVRINFDAEQDPGPIKQTIVQPSGGELLESVVEKKVVDDARSNAKRDGNPIAGLITRAVMSPFPITEAGRYRSYITIADQKFLACSLNIRIVELMKNGVQPDGATVSTIPWPTNHP